MTVALQPTNVNVGVKSSLLSSFSTCTHDVTDAATVDGPAVGTGTITMATAAGEEHNEGLSLLDGENSGDGGGGGGSNMQQSVVVVIG